MKRALHLIVFGLLINLIGIFLAVKDVETYSTVAIITGVIMELSGVILAAVKFLNRILGFQDK
ncbi:MAG: hypothetical protein ACJAY8_000271 [Sphingobacteriales bacterium]|jgi:hypothetical protein